MKDLALGAGARLTTLDLGGGLRVVLAGGGGGWFWLTAGAIALALLLALYRAERRLVPRRVGLQLLGLRLAAAVALTAALFEPTWERAVRVTRHGRVVVAVNVSESMATADPGRPSRREVARRLMASGGSPLARIAAAHPVDAVAFAREATPPGTLASVAGLLERPGPPGDPSALVTDWQPALAEALTISESSPVVGVVLLTDGLRNAPGDDVSTAGRLAGRGIPVYPVLIGTTAPPRDAAVAAVRAPEVVYKGDVADVEATLKLDGYAGREVAVTLERPGAPPVRRVVRGPADGSRPVVSFRVPLATVGSVPLTVAVAPPPGDARADNDRRTVRVQVTDDRARVLLVDGEARWEFRYLFDALSRDPRVAVQAVVFHPPGSAGASGLTYASRLPTAPAQPRGRPEPDPLGEFDAVIIGDVDPLNVAPETWERLAAYVAERGGTLILGAGPRSWPAAQGSVAAVRTLLPVLDPRVVAFDAAATDPAHPSLPPGVAVAPAPAALADPRAWPMLQLGPDADRGRLLWAGLPRLPWVLGGRAKPGATVLATAGADTAAVIAAQPYGLGKVLWVGTDATWRWRHRVGDAHHHRFWGQAVRWAASGKLAAGNAWVRFGPLRPKVAAGEGAPIQARIADGVPGVGPDLLIAARIEGDRAGKTVAVVPLRAAAGGPRTFKATAPALPAGSYTVRLDVPQLAEALHLEPGPAPAAALEVAERDTSERVELAAAREPLDRLAAATGGRVFTVEDVEALPTLLRARTQPSTETVTTPLWDHPASLLLFFAILSAEWVVRKRAGLP